jgi:hypothetical protein
MAEARQQSDWLRLGIAVMWIVNRNGWTKEPISAADVIPAIFRPPPGPEPERTPEEIESENRQAWHVLDAVFGRP